MPLNNKTTKHTYTRIYMPLCVCIYNDKFIIIYIIYDRYSYISYNNIHNILSMAYNIYIYCNIYGYHEFTLWVNDRPNFAELINRVLNNNDRAVIYIYIYIYIYKTMLVVTKWLCGFVANQVQNNMERAHYLG